MCKEIEKSKRMRKIRDSFKKIGDIKGTFHARMGMIKDRNGKDLTEAEEIRKRWQEHKEVTTRGCIGGVNWQYNQIPYVPGGQPSNWTITTIYCRVFPTGQRVLSPHIRLLSPGVHHWKDEIKKKRSGFEGQWGLITGPHRTGRNKDFTLKRCTQNIMHIGT